MRTAQTKQCSELASSSAAQPRVLRRTLATLVPLALLGCEGMLGAPRGPAAPGAPLDINGSADAGVFEDPEEMDPGPAPMLLLSTEQYANTVRALFGEVAGLDGVLGHASSPSALGLVQAEV